MSKPKTSNKDYGYQPNMADGVVDMESRVTSGGMSMAGKVEKHSEFMEPNTTPDYNDMEYNYSYPPGIMQPMSPVWPIGPGQNWPVGGEDYTPENFRCIANCCCCAGNLVGPVNISCTYPIVAGPWVRNPDGTKCDPGKNTGANQSVSCINPCGDGNCPPDIRVMIQSPKQSPKGKKPYPGQIREVKVTMLQSCGRVGNPSCPPVSACCTGVSITYTSKNMFVSTSQTLTAVGPVSGCTYQMRVISGGGSLVVNGANSYSYTAPATAPNCTTGVVIGLYDKTTCVLCTTTSLNVTAPSNYVAGFYVETKTPYFASYSGWGCSEAGHNYDCGGNILASYGGSESCANPCWIGEGGIDACNPTNIDAQCKKPYESCVPSLYCPCNFPNRYTYTQVPKSIGTWVDTRSDAAKAAGCCLVY